MQFDEATIERTVEPIIGEAIRVRSVASAGLPVVLAVLVAHFAQLLHRKCPDPSAAAEHAKVEGRPFFFGEDDQLQRCRGVRAQNLKRRDDADDAVIFSARRDRIDVCEPLSQSGSFQSNPSGPRVDIPRGVDPNRAADFLGFGNDVIARTLPIGRERRPAVADRRRHLAMTSDGFDVSAMRAA